MDRLELIHAFRKKYRFWVKPDLESLKICSDGRDCFLEIRFEQEKQALVLDLSHIREETNFDVDNCFSIDYMKMTFCPKNDIVDNANEFFNFDDYSMVNCFELLFTQQAIEEICTEFESNLRV